MPAVSAPRNTPVSSRMNVDLPTPFAPSSATRSPGRMQQLIDVEQQMIGRGCRRHAQPFDANDFFRSSPRRDPASDRAASRRVTNVRSASIRSARFSMFFARRANFSLSKSRPQIANRFALARIASILRSSASRLRRAAASACGERGTRLAERQIEAPQSSIAQKPRGHVRHRVEKRSVVRHEHECAAVGVQIRLEDAHRREIEMVRRFVEQQQVGLGNHRAREHQPVLLSAGQSRRSPDRTRRLRRCRVRRAAPPRASARSVCASGSPFEHGVDDAQRRAISAGRNCSTRPIFRPRVKMISPASGARAAARKSSSVDLPQPLWPTRPTRAPTGYGELEIAEQRSLADAMRDVARLEQRGHVEPDRIAYNQVATLRANNPTRRPPRRVADSRRKSSGASADGDGRDHRAERARVGAAAGSRHRNRADEIDLSVRSGAG